MQHDAVKILNETFPRALIMTAVFENASDAPTVRRQAPITALRLDGRAVTFQVTIPSGKMVFTCRTIYDEELGGGGPGLLRHREATDRLFTHPELKAIDSCDYHEPNCISTICAGRRAVSNLTVAVKSGSGALFGVVSGLETLRRRLLKAGRSLPFGA